MNKILKDLKLLCEEQYNNYYDVFWKYEDLGHKFELVEDKIVDVRGLSIISELVYRVYDYNGGVIGYIKIIDEDSDSNNSHTPYGMRRVTRVKREQVLQDVYIDIEL